MFGVRTLSCTLTGAVSMHTSKRASPMRTRWEQGGPAGPAEGKVAQETSRWAGRENGSVSPQPRRLPPDWLVVLLVDISVKCSTTRVQVRPTTYFCSLLCDSDVVPALAKDLDAMAVVTDMSPLNEPRRWAHEVAEELAMAGKGTPLFQVMCSRGARSTRYVL